MDINTNTQLYDKAVDRTAMVRLYERRVNGKIELVIDDHVVRVDQLIREAKASPQGFERLREAIDIDLRKTFGESFQISKRSLLDLASDQLSYGVQNIEAAASHVWRPKSPQRKILETIVLEKPLYKDVALEQGWSNIAVSEKKRLEGVMRKGMAEGKTLEDIALAVRTGNVHAITRLQARGLVITAITSVTNQVDQATYMANEQLLSGWQYVAVLDSRTTALCAHRDGTIYPVNDTLHLPPAHFHCRSTTVPIVKSWNDLSKLESVAEIRKRNLTKLSPKQIAALDGQTPLRETYDTWLRRQPQDVQLKHIGDYKKLQLFQDNQLTLDKFTNDAGNSVGIKELRTLTGFTAPSDTARFAMAREKLDAMKLWATTPDDFINDIALRNTLQEYYYLQSTDLNGTLSLTNYRGALISTKKMTKNRVFAMPPREDQLVFNPITGHYDDVRLYQPNFAVHSNNMRLVEESKILLDRDKAFIKSMDESLKDRMSVNERAVILDNLRITFGRARENNDIWTNFKAVSQGQIKFDVMNVSDSIETQLRKDKDLLKRLQNNNYLDPVLGPVQLDEMHDQFLDNIREKNLWEDRTAPQIAKELHGIFNGYFNTDAPLIIRKRITNSDLQQFYLRFAQRLSLADMPDRDQFAVALGRDLYNAANINGDRKSWFKLGTELLENPKSKKFFEIETYGVQKRRMKSRLSNNYFGPYYDTLSYNIRVTDPRIVKYAQLTRKVELGLRVAVVDDANRLVIREGYKTYWIKNKLTYTDTRIPITSTSSFSDFPEELIDANMVKALNWAANTKYRVDDDFYNFTKKLLYFTDDKGKADYYNGLNTYRKYIVSRGDAYERFKAMEWLQKDGKSFSNHPFVDHRARIYDRGLISPQSGETFRPFLNTEAEKNLGVNGYHNLQDQIGAFLGGLSDTFESRYNGLSVTGRQKIAEKWRPELVKIGNQMLRAKPADIRNILENEIVAQVDGEDLGKFLRFAIEQAKIDNYLVGDYKNLKALNNYKTALAMEQDASSSGAQIIALTTKNKQLAEMSNVLQTTQKRRLYDEIAAATFNDPRFKILNEKLGLNEKDLRKAAKAQNMVTFYGAGERTGTLNVEGKLAKVLNKDTNTLVVTASERETVLNEISARIARYEKFDTETADELRVLRNNVKDIFNKGLDPGDDIMDQLYFLDPKTRDLVNKMTMSYDKIVTPQDFKDIASIMSEHLAEEVPILKDFTKFFGRLAEDFLKNAKPSTAAFDWKAVAKTAVLGTKRTKDTKKMASVRDKRYTLPDWASRILGLKAKEPVREKILKSFGFWNPKGTLASLINGVEAPEARRMGAKYLKAGYLKPTFEMKDGKITLIKEVKPAQIQLLYANKLPKSWTNVPWVNFDGKILEQNFTQVFEERLAYKDANGNWINNILQVPQKTEASWWEQVINDDGKINDIADSGKARTAFAVNGNHSNDAVIVKRFHMWGADNNIPTSTIHDAFFTNIADMLQGREALRDIYAETLKQNVVLNVLNEMKARGLPEELYQKYLEEAIDKGLMPIAGKSKIGGKIVTEDDILKPKDLLKAIPQDFKQDLYWYGVG
jgi:SPP1 gp7 family putative phage head morphogenesis protein